MSPLGTATPASHASTNARPRAPVSATTFMPSARAASAAATTFFDVPLVVIAISMLPARPSASTCRRNTSS